VNKWAAMFKDRRWLIAAGAVAVIGVAALMRKRQSGDTAGDGDGSTPVKGAAFDTSGTDMAAWVQEYLKNELDAIRQGLPGGALTPPPSGANPNPSVPRMPSLDPDRLPRRLTGPTGTMRVPVPIPRM